MIVNAYNTNMYNANSASYREYTKSYKKDLILLFILLTFYSVSI